MEDKIKIMALGGLDEDGKDLYLIEINGDIFVFNAGFKYPTKLTPGIDFIIADFSYLIDNKDRIKAYIIPKSKKNSFGALPYIYEKCPAPIYCTFLTTIFLKEFSNKYQVNNNYEFNLIDLPSTIKISNYIFDFFSTCASMPSSFGFSLRTNLGNIVYSGDFIVEYSNDKYFKLDLNTLGKIAEHPTLLLMNESRNSIKSGYCSPNHKIMPFLKKCFMDAPGRCFIAVADDNLYHFEEVFKMCNETNKKIAFYDNETLELYSVKKYINDLFTPVQIIPIEEALRVKEQELVILIAGNEEKLYDKISLLANKENELRQIKLEEKDTFILALPPTSNTEVIATSTIDELYKTGCNVKYIKRSGLNKMHACEEDIKMLISLLKPKYYLPIEGYYVNLLTNAKIALSMRVGLGHHNLFLLDNGQSLEISQDNVNVDYNYNFDKPKVGDLMIDGVGVGDIVNDIINDRTKLSIDGVLVLGIGVSKSMRKVICNPDVQMRGFLYLKDKDADILIKEISEEFLNYVNSWASNTNDFNTKLLESEIKNNIKRKLKKSINREPVIDVNVIVVE